MPQLYSGTSGFAYASWKPDFYPADAPSKKFLSHYAERLNAVEINYTFRRLPSAATLESWVAATRSGFIFALKAHMRITHIQKLKTSECSSRRSTRCGRRDGWARCCSNCLPRSSATFRCWRSF